jgi:hypothetical protein
VNTVRVQNVHFTAVKNIFIQKHGCQMLNTFAYQNPYLGVFWWEMVVFIMVNWNVLLSFGLFDGTLVYFVVIWCIFAIFVCWNKNLATLTFLLEFILLQKNITVW